MANRPTLSALAHQHAAKRWPKKKRNADLRRHGYDPDGEHGRIYRDAFHRACQSARMGEHAADLGESADITFLWDVSDREWPEWVAQGCGDLPLSEYRERLGLVRQQIESTGNVVAFVTATVAEVLSTIRELGLQNDAAGRAAAIGLLGLKQQ